MIPHSYTVDSLSRSQDLASKIISSNTPQQIISACASVETFLHTHSSDQSRYFFSITFPTLILKLFGFNNDSSATLTPQCSSWIDVVSSSNDPDFAARVFHLLSPNGIVFNSIFAVDRKSLVKFVFPTERLPEWARLILSSQKDIKILSNLCPLFKGKVKEDSTKSPVSMYQIQLNVFEYYILWFAYYPICRSSNENNVDNILTKRTKMEKFRLENWTHSIPGFSSNVKSGTELKIECNLYLRLLHAYLHEFVPVSGLNVHQQAYRISILNYTGGYDGPVLMRAEFLVDAFVNYWLIDNDFSPLSVNVCKCFGVPPRLSVIAREIPPTSGLGELVKSFVKYLNFSSVVVTANHSDSNVEGSGSPKWRVPDSPLAMFDSGVKSRDLASAVRCVSAVGSWNMWIQRPFYRFILRTFLFCPMGTSIKNASDVFSVWVCYMEPWSIRMDDFADFDALINVSTKNAKKDDSPSQDVGYSSLWQEYVLSNYLYYSSLVMHFIGFAHKFLHTNPELIVQMVLKVMDVLTSSKELIDLIKNVNTEFHSKQGSSKSKLHGIYKLVPAIREQLQDWEEGLCESDADGSFLHENWNKDLRLFDDGEDGGQRLLQLFILRADAELQAISCDNLALNHQYIDTLKAQVSCFFGGHSIKPIAFSLEPEQQLQCREEIFKPKRVGHHALADFKYKGDWMKRPISDDEVAWLAKLLIWLSDWLNDSLGLNQQKNSSTVGPQWSYVEVSGDVVGNVCGPLEIIKAMVYAIGNWLRMLAAALVDLMRKRGVRLNLRMFASKKIIMFLLMFAVFSVLKKALRQLR